MPLFSEGDIVCLSTKSKQSKLPTEEQEEETKKVLATPIAPKRSHHKKK